MASHDHLNIKFVPLADDAPSVGSDDSDRELKVMHRSTSAGHKHIPLADDEPENADENGDGDDEDNYENIVDAVNVHKTYLLGVEGVPALRGVSLSIKKGEFVVVLGKSGGGKTSLLNIIGTIDKPTKGELTICGKRITNKTVDAEFALLRLRKIGFVFQTFNLISSMTALENVELPMILDGRLPRDARRRRATALLARVGMGARLDHTPSQMSGGEQQRVTIARAIANSPDLLLLDEPTGDLDTVNSHIILQMLLDLNRKHGITCVMVTHDQALASFAHRVIHMVDGKIFQIEEVTADTRRAAEQDLTDQIQKHAERAVEEAVEVRDPFTFYSFSKALTRVSERTGRWQDKHRKQKHRQAGGAAARARASSNGATSNGHGRQSFVDSYADM